jgi:Grx4 family monothiol glutaredoxin
MTNIDKEITELLNSYPVILFMKGDKHFPKCGYSRLAVEILNEYEIDYVTFDILQDENFREQLKLYSDWPTYPQLYVKSELIGGSDILKELHLNGELSTILNL